MKCCLICGNEIATATLEVLPDTSRCIKCAAANPVPIDFTKFDLSEASPINRNGFAPKD